MTLHAMRHQILFTLCLCLSLLSLRPALSQATFGHIVGTATDASGALIPGVTVTVSNPTSGETYTDVTGRSGDYTFDTLIPGIYTVHAEAAGFRPITVTGITLQVAQTARYDLTLQVGSAAATVTVSASAPVLSLDTSDVGQVITTKQILELPLNGRNYVQLASLTNGVLLQNTTESGGPQFISDGNRVVQNSFLIDGVESRIQREGGYGINLSIDAIQEFKIFQNSFSAEYGRGSAILDTVLKSGTNAIHGSAFEFVRNSAFDARNYFDTTGSIAPLRLNQFGGSFGGPIKKNRLFYFLDYEGQRVAQSLTEYTLVPTQTILSGNFAGLPPVIDPTTGQQFPNNQIPATRISQYGKAATPYYPAPNSSAVAGYNYSGTVPNPTTMNQGIAHIDYIVGAHDRISGHYVQFDYDVTSSSLLPYNGTEAYSHALNIAGQWIHTFNASLLNIVTYGYARTNTLEGPYPLSDTSAVGAFGLQNLSPSPDTYGPPYTAPAGYGAFGTSPYEPYGSTDTDNQFDDQVVYTKGRQAVKVGVDFRLYGWNDLGYATQNGLYQFNGQYSHNAIGDLLLGLPDYVYVDQLGPGYSYEYYTNNGEDSYYVQDDIRVSQSLTVNAGLRYEYVQWPKERNNQFAEWDFQTGQLVFACHGIPCRVAPPYYNGWSPRLGFAFAPTKKTVIRAGTSIMNGNFRQWEVSLFHFTPPFVYEYFLNNGIPAPTFSTATLWPVVPTNPQDINFNLVTVDYQNPDKVLPRYYEWNLNVQQEVLPNLLVQVGYVGNRGVHLPVRYDANAPIAINIQAPRPYPAVGFVSGNASAGWSSYNALQVKAERRYSSGLAFLGTYTWSRNLGIRNYDNYTTFNFYDLRTSFGPVQNIPQVGTISFNYELPVGSGKPFIGDVSKVVNGFIGGWQVNGIISFASGDSLDAYSNVNNGQGNRAGNGPNCVGKPNLPSGQRSITHWFNTAAFQAPAEATYGNCGIGVIYGPGSQDWDLSLFKTTHIGDRAALQLRFEGFNTFNHPNFGSPDTTVGDTTFGVINSALPGREIQLGAKLIF